MKVLLWVKDSELNQSLQIPSFIPYSPSNLTPPVALLSSTSIHSLFCSIGPPADFYQKVMAWNFNSSSADKSTEKPYMKSAQRNAVTQNILQ